MTFAIAPIASVYEIPKIKTLPGLGDIGTCRLRLLSARARLEEAWPKDSRRHSKELPAQIAAEVRACLRRVPTPLPLEIGGRPEVVIPAEPYDLLVAVGRVFDAILAVLAVDDFDVLYTAPLTVYGFKPSVSNSARPSEEKGLSLMVKPSVGDLATEIFAELEMISLAIGAR
jgi:hypothetical protein